MKKYSILFFCFALTFLILGIMIFLSPTGKDFLIAKNFVGFASIVAAIGYTILGIETYKKARAG